MIKPIFSEKSLKNSKLGKFTFKVDRALTKFQIKALIADLFGVTVVSVFTSNYKGNVRRTIRGKTVKTPSYKKAVVTLKSGEKISLWDSEKKDVKPAKEKLKVSKEKSK